MAEMVSSATLLASARVVCTSLVNFWKEKYKGANLILPANGMINTHTKLLHLVVFAVKPRDEGDEGESHDGHQRELPGHRKHEDEEASALDGAPQEDVDILSNEVTHLGGVS